MKKFAMLFITAILTMGTLAGCGQKTEPTTPAETTGDKAQTPDTNEKLKVTLLVTGSFGDKAFNDSALAGTKMLEQQMGDKCEITTIEMGTDKTKFQPSLVDASESDADVIITGLWEMKEVLEQTAPLYKDKKYIIFDTSVDYDDYDLDNVYSVDYKQNEAGFLSGVLAALVTTSDMEFANPDKLIGFVGARDTSPVINDSLVGYIQGAKFIDPEIKVDVAYVGSFVDSAKAKEVTLAQYAKGADVIFVAAGPASVGAIEAASTSQKYIIGVDSDQAVAYAGSKEADYIISSAIKGIDQTVYRSVELLLEGQLPFNTHETLGLAEGVVGLADNEVYQRIVPEEIRTKVKDAEKELLDEKVTVESAMGMEDTKLQEMINSAK